MSRLNELYNKMMAFKGLKNKDKVFDSLMFYSLARTNKMFSYSGLPDTIPAEILELYIQMLGYCIFTKHNGKYYIYFGGLGGRLDEYYRPTVAIINNPYQEYNAELEIGKECVLIPNDTMFQGLYPLNAHYIELIVENLVSMRVASINSRYTSLTTAPDERTKAAVDEYFKKVSNGDICAVLDSSFMADIQVNPLTGNVNSRTLTELTQYHQYILGTLHNELGLQSGYNMKRERLTAAETELDTTATASLIDEMLFTRRKACERINKLYGLNISVVLNGVWQGMDKINAKAETDSNQNKEGFKDE